MNDTAKTESAANPLSPDVLGDQKDKGKAALTAPERDKPVEVSEPSAADERIDGKHVYAATNYRGDWMIWMQDDRPPIEKLLRGPEEMDRDEAEGWVRWWDQHVEHWRTEAVDVAEYRQMIEAMRLAARYIEGNTSGEDSTRASSALWAALEPNRQRSFKASGGSDTEWIVQNSIRETDKSELQTVVMDVSGFLYDEDTKLWTICMESKEPMDLRIVHRTPKDPNLRCGDKATIEIRANHLSYAYNNHAATRATSEEGNATGTPGSEATDKPNTPQTPTPKVEDSVVEVGGDCNCEVIGMADVGLKVCAISNEIHNTQPTPKPVDTGGVEA